MDDHTEDVHRFVSRTDAGRPELGQNVERPPVLEIHQIWGQTLLDTQHAEATRDVTVGTAVGYRWSVLGIDMGWVSPAWARVLPYVPPIWSDVQAVSRTDLDAPLPDDERFTLFEGGEDGHVARIRPEWGALIDDATGRHGVEDLVQQGRAVPMGPVVEVPIPDDATLTVQIGEVMFRARRVPAAQRVDRPTTQVDAPFAAMLTTWAVAGAWLAVLVALAPPPAVVEVIDDDLDDIVAVLQAPPIEPPKPLVDPPSDAPPVPGSADRTDSPPDPVDDLRPEDADREAVMSTSVMQFLSDESYGDAGLGALDNAIAAIGVKGGSFRVGEGLSRGSGFGGGGGQAEGIGDDMGTRGGDGFQPRGGGKKRHGTPITTLADPVVIGALTKSQVEEVILRHTSAIRYCYQRSLQRDPSLEGKVVIRFTVAKDGSVSSTRVAKSSMNHAEVEGCLTGRFMRMQFPEPKGGGHVVVSYPLFFAPS